MTVGKSSSKHLNQTAGPYEKETHELNTCLWRYILPQALETQVPELMDFMEGPRHRLFV